MIKKIANLVAFLIIPTATLANDVFSDLDKGVAVTRANFAQLAQTSMPLSVARSAHRSKSSSWVSAFYYDEQSSVVFSISEKPELFATKYPEREFLSLWSLARWRYQHVTPEIKKRYKEFYRGEYPRSEYTIKKLWAPGCFQNSPLRYGDVDEDDVEELVLFLGNDFVVFSPEKGKIVFAENLRLDDWLPKERTVQELESKFYPDPSPYQYLSGILSDTPDVAAGYRGYSKLYLGDFDDDDNPDILVWRKLYISRTSDDSVEGFEKIRDEWQHFKRNSDGEYVPQDTQAAQVQSWLQANGLTWQKGYPSKSECAGEEGELIPEMHDPLLNDPDVLQ